MADTTDTTSETRSPEEIRRDIEETRGELGDTVEALAAKADVKAQAKKNPVQLAVGGALVAGFLLGRMASRG